MEAEIYENLKIGIGLIEKNPDEARGHTLINTTWVYSTKLKDGNTVFKARLTAGAIKKMPQTSTMTAGPALRQIKILYASFWQSWRICQGRS